MSDTPRDFRRLRYLSADHLEGPLAETKLDVRDHADRPLGRFDGVIFDPIAGHARYLVVDDTRLFRHNRYLVPIDPTQVDIEHRALRVEMNDTQPIAFDANAIPAFSDEDLLDAMFRKLA
jgi:hypothetical protein